MDTNAAAMTGRCASCRWWDEPEPGERLSFCGRIADYPNRDDDLDLAVIAAGDSCAAVLLTAPDFGCVQWAAREAATE